MQQFMRAALGAAIVVSLASCGGNSAPAAVTSGAPAAPAAAGGSTLAHTDLGTEPSTKVYIVQLRAPAVANYGGGIQGLAATRAAKGSKLDSASSAAAGYRNHLKARQDAVLARAANSGSVRKLHTYTNTLNGFAARLSDAQVRSLAASPEVLAITEDRLHKLDTATTPSFLGLTGRDGFYRDFDARGENVVIGLIDSGIWPESQSFADVSHRGGPLQGRPSSPRGIDEATPSSKGGHQHDHPWAYRRLRGWSGTCVSGEQFVAEQHCNGKLIGARFFNAGMGGDARVKELFPYEYLSARDADGHGTHTASTAAGNAGVPATGVAAALGRISGIAPRARIAMYKACWGREEPGSGCLASDTVAAIDQAVEDGVDVINFSIDGTTGNLLDPVEQAFLRAAEAGVFVAASAGNTGPGASTVAHPSPWVTTIAAGTHDRSGTAELSLGDGTRFSGVSLALALPAAPLINAADAGLPDANPESLRLCFAASDNAGVPVLDPAKVAGKVVVCDRGVSPRPNKSLAVAEAGGVGMVLVNTAEGSLNADLHRLPTVHLAPADGAAVKAYAATARATAAIGQARISTGERAPLTAIFSARGPTLAGAGNFLKPDLIAPGQDILAAVAQARPGAPEQDTLSGTSMAAPHVAGVAALLKELHPRWSPMAIKSALMTTASDVLDGAGTDAAVIFSQGAGHLRPAEAADPGLVFESDIDDWLGFQCGALNDSRVCDERGVAVLNPSDLNTPSIAIGTLLDEQVVTRRVTNVGRGTATYRPSVTGLAGFDVTVRPHVLVLAPGQTRSFTVRFKRTSATLDAYEGGQITWTGGSRHRRGSEHVVRVPVVVQPLAVAAPAEAGGSFSLRFGYSGTFGATVRGLAPAGTLASNVPNGLVRSVRLNIPAGLTHVRFSLFDANVAPAANLDLAVLDPENRLAALSTGATSNESIDLVRPAAGAYTVRIGGTAVPGDAPANFTLFAWFLGPGDARNAAVVAPPGAQVGTTGSIELSFTGLVPGTRYLGAVDFNDGAGTAFRGSTLIRVDP